METIRVIILIAAIITTIFIIGHCLYDNSNTEEIEVVNKPIYTNQTLIINSGQYTTCIGRINNINYVKETMLKDTIYFEDGTIICLCDCNNFIFKLGNIHIIKYNNDGYYNGFIKNVEILKE